MPGSWRIQRALPHLLPREVLTLRRRYVDRWTFREIGRELGLSVERTRQIAAKAELRLALAIIHPEIDFSTMRRERIPPPPRASDPFVFLRDVLERAVRENARRKGLESSATDLFRRSFLRGPEGFTRETLWRALEIATGIETPPEKS